MPWLLKARTVTTTIEVSYLGTDLQPSIDLLCPFQIAMNDVDGIQTNSTVLVSFIGTENEIDEVQQVLQLHFGQMYVISTSYFQIGMTKW